MSQPCMEGPTTAANIMFMMCCSMRLLDHVNSVAASVQPIIKEDAVTLIDACYTVKVSQDIILHMVMDSQTLYFIYEEVDGGLFVSNTLSSCLVSQEAIVWDPPFRTDMLWHAMIEDYCLEFELEWSVFTRGQFRSIKTYDIYQSPLAS
jgi:hypothetical protein